MGLDPMTTLEIVNMTTTCHAAPVQIEGELSDGRVFYFRSRFRKIELGIGQNIEEAADQTVMHSGIHFELTVPGESDYLLSYIPERWAQQLVPMLIQLWLNMYADDGDVPTVVEPILGRTPSWTDRYVQTFPGNTPSDPSETPGEADTPAKPDGSEGNTAEMGAGRPPQSS